MGCTESKSEITRNHDKNVTAEGNSSLALSSGSGNNNTQLSSPPSEEFHRQQQQQQLTAFSPQEEDAEEKREGLYCTSEHSVEESPVVLPSFTSDQEAASAMVPLPSTTVEEEQKDGGVLLLEEEGEPQHIFSRPESTTTRAAGGPIISQWLQDMAASGTPPPCDDDHDNDDDRLKERQSFNGSSRILSCTLTPNTSLTSNMPRFQPNALTPTGEWLFASSSPQQQEVDNNEGLMEENTHSQHRLMPLIFQFDAYPLPPPHTATLTSMISSSAFHHPLLPPFSRNTGRNHWEDCAHGDLESEYSRRCSSDEDDDRESTVFTLSVDGSSTTSLSF